MWFSGVPLSQVFKLSAHHCAPQGSPTSPSLPLCLQVLDAPALADDFYLNLVDWSSQNVLAVGLGSCVYLWSAASSAVRVKGARDNRRGAK